MPPGRKQKKHQTFKTSSNYVHPSLATRSNNSSQPSAHEQVSHNSVQERIDHLRRTQGQRVNASTLLEQLRSSPSRQLISGRRTAGPPPPRSWLENDNGRRTFKYGISSRTRPERRASTLSYFPGSEMPLRTSLLHHTLKLMASNFEWHLEYDHVYLSVMPLEIKEVLLSYVAHFGPEPGISVNCLKTLFPSDGSYVESTSSDDLRRLDLGGSAGHAFTIKQLERYCYPKANQAVETVIAESWDLELSLSTKARFPCLKMLSLAYPGNLVTWADLLSFSRHLGTLTHLSLAYWPEPILVSSEPHANPGATAAPEDSDFLDAGYVLKQLARATPSLQYLSLEGCSDWLYALMHASPTVPGRRKPTRTTDFEMSQPSELDDNGSDPLIWTSSWRHMNVLRLGQGWVPSKVNLDKLFLLYSARGGDPELMARLGSFMLQAPRPNSLQVRQFPMSRDVQVNDRVTMQEIYTITAPTSVADNVEADMRRRNWCRNEVSILKIGNWLREQRKRAGQKPCIIDYGWNKQDLMKLGYEEDDLFHAGF